MAKSRIVSMVGESRELSKGSRSHKWYQSLYSAGVSMRTIVLVGVEDNLKRTRSKLAS